MEGLQCKHLIGCHACPIDHLQDDFRMFRHALKEFSKKVDGKLKQEAESMIRRLNAWIEPRGGVT